MVAREREGIFAFLVVNISIAKFSNVSLLIFFTFSGITFILKMALFLSHLASLKLAFGLPDCPFVRYPDSDVNESLVQIVIF